MKKTILTYSLSLMCTAVLAQDPSTTPSMKSDRHAHGLKEEMTKLTLTNESFVKKVAESNQAEIDLSKLALTNSQNPQITGFAQQMIKDHTLAATELQKAAEKKNMTVPVDSDPKHKAEMDKLAKLTGADFDRAYSEQMRKDHHRAVELFTAAANDKSIDSILQDFATKLLPTLRKHQSEAQQLLK